jgi:hypothetical protein
MCDKPLATKARSPSCQPGALLDAVRLYRRGIFTGSTLSGR